MTTRTRVSRTRNDKLVSYRRTSRTMRLASLKSRFSLRDHYTNARASIIGASCSAKGRRRDGSTMSIRIARTARALPKRPAINRSPLRAERGIATPTATMR